MVTSKHHDGRRRGRTRGPKRSTGVLVAAAVGVVLIGAIITVALVIPALRGDGDERGARRQARPADREPRTVSAAREAAPAPTVEAPAAARPVADEQEAAPPRREGEAPAEPARQEARPPTTEEPESVQSLPPRRPERSRWSWNRAQAEVTEKGDLVWKPEPFRFEPGASIRYIDFERGRDSNSGTGRTSAWKHHPWDLNATGTAKGCRGVHTYVFKRGVIYRGRLVGTESGTPEEPIQLTSDPSWGRGEAVICGSERVTKWHRGVTHKDIPQRRKVWYADLDFPARNVWVVDRGNLQRLVLARTPNWKVSNPEDVLSEWWTWEQPRWWEREKHKTTVGGKKMHRGTDAKHLTKDPEYYKDAIVWTEWGIVMGTPFPTRVEAFDAQKKALAFQGRWWGDSGVIITGNRYYLEDKPHYLDEAGEFWFEKKGAGGTLYVRLPGDKNPNATVVEAAKRYNLLEDRTSVGSPKRMDIYPAAKKGSLETAGLKHVYVTGLTFRFTNTWWDLPFPPWMHKEVDNACIRLLGSGDDVRISNCRFEHAGKAVRIDQLTDKCTTGSFEISDNEMQYIDHGAIKTKDNVGGQDLRILRNELFMIGLRPYRQSDGHALSVGFADTLEVAGNALDRCYGAGLFLFGGKGSGRTGDVPLCRMLVHHNKVTNSLLAANDWGGIETWQGGPTYVFNNISGNANGLWNWAYSPGKPASARLGFAYYLDGGFKNYHFNNVAWGISNDLKSRLCSNTAFYNATTTTHNALFNNTAYMFAKGSSWSPAGGRGLYLGNLWHDISLSVFTHGKQKEDKGAVYKHYPLETIAYGRNVFHRVPQKLGGLEGSGSGKTDLEGLRRAASQCGLLASDVGDITQTSPLRDAANHDFRPAAGSAVIDHGVKVFVPWSLYAMVGEWNFRRNNKDPSVLLDDHWYMTPYYVNREDYRNAPTFNLKAVNVTADDYVEGPLEDWTHGALRFNGTDQYAVVSHREMTRPYSYKAKVNKQDRTLTVSGDEIATPDVHAGNFLIEVYFRTEAGSVLVSKMSGSGYQLALNRAGGVTLTLKSGGRTAEVAAGARITDGTWHHVIAEVDRSARRATIYVDGNRAAEGAIELGETASLSNEGDLLVGKGPDGHFFAGAIDFLRIARGTLADARTTIEELYDWQFDGPFLRDFAGREPAGARRDAGAFEYAD